MSLPPTTKDISAHPAKGSVVAPTDKAAKDADVDRKIRLYGVIDAFRNGKMPSNAQIDSTLQYVLNNSPVDLNKLSPEGKKLIEDTREIINTARLMVQEKNSDELFQQFVWNTREVDVNSLKQGGDLSEKLPIDATKAQADSDQAVKHLRTLLTLILSNSEVRKLLSDFSLIGRDLLSRGASKFASGIAPAQERLQNVDQSAPNDQFITEGGRRAGPDETPVLEARLPGTDARVRQHPHDDQPQVAMNANDTPRPVGDVRDDLKDRAAPVAGQAADSARSQVQEINEADTPEEAEAKKNGMMDRMRQFRDNVRGGINDRIPQQHKDTARDHANDMKRFLSEDYFPEERRDQFIFRMKKVIMECQKHDDYQNSIRWLLDYFEEYAKHGHTTLGLGKEHVGGAAETSNLTKSISELRTLLERFANGKSLTIVTDAVDALIDDANRDQELRGWFEAVDLYIRKVLLEPGYVLEPDCNNHANTLRETGKEFYDVKYRDHFNNLFRSVGDWFSAMGEDPLNKQFGEDWARLTRDLLFDSDGGLKFKSTLWNDIRKVIMPTLIDQVGYIPIPRVEYSDDSLDLVVENLTLQGRNLFPNIIQLEAHNFVKFSPYNAITDDHSHRVKFSLEQMQADMRDVAFYYRKKTGIARMKDSGIADVVLGGEGLSATIELVSTRKDPTSVFKVANVHVKVDTLKFAIRDSNHDFLYKTLRPLATGLIKKQIEKAMRDALTTGLEYVDGQLVGVRQRMERDEGQSRTDVLKELLTKNKDESTGDTASAHTTSKSTLSSKTTNSQFKIVSDKRKSLLVDQGHPAGWVNRTAEKEKLTAQGQEWRSDAFTIV